MYDTDSQKSWGLRALMTDYHQGFVDALQIVDHVAREMMDRDDDPHLPMFLDVVEDLWNDAEEARVEDLLEEKGFPDERPHIEA